MDLDDLTTTIRDVAREEARQEFAADRHEYENALLEAKRRAEAAERERDDALLLAQTTSALHHQLIDKLKELI